MFSYSSRKSGLSLSLISAIMAIRLLSVFPAAAQSPAKLTALSGEYTNPAEPDTPLSFYLQNGQLYVESDRQAPRPLKAVSASEFHLAGRNAGISTDHVITYTFNSDALTVLEPSQPAAKLTRTGNAVHHLFRSYARSEEMIPVRDGIRLHVVILTPTDIRGPLPILIQRTPYGVDNTTEASFFRSHPELARAGYIYVGADIRGRFKSEGKFVMCRPLADHTAQPSGSAPETVTDESTDTYDTIDWLLKHIPNNNGRVGVLGTSYPGFLAMMAGITPDATHPAVKAISPQAPMIDTWMGDDFFHNGAFRQSYGYDYVFGLETSKEMTEVDYGKDASGKPRDGYDYFLERGSFAEDVKRSPVTTKLPTWQAFLEHTTYDSFWRSRGVEHHLNAVSVPTLTVGGYYDQEDMWGPQAEYASLEPHDSKHENFLVLGPWRHGYWSSSSRHLGALQYGESIGNEYRSQIEARFFAHYLKDAPGSNASGFDLEDTASFQTGSNTWKRYAQFPPAAAKSTPFALCANGEIVSNKMCGESLVDSVSYVSDPANPVPYRHRPIQPTYSDGSEWYNWMVEDQRFVTGRKDVAVWKLPVLDRDLTLTGEVLADIFASTTGSDGDFVVKLIDEYPAAGPDADPDPAMRGFQLMTNMEIFRGRYLAGFDKPAALKPGEINEFRWSLHDVDHVFKKGHTLMVQIQSTWFPLYDRNPQTFVPSIMTANPEDYKPATISIVNGYRHESKLILPLIP